MTAIYHKDEKEHICDATGYNINTDLMTTTTNKIIIYEKNKEKQTIDSTYSRGYFIYCCTVEKTRDNYVIWILEYDHSKPNGSTVILHEIRKDKKNTSVDLDIRNIVGCTTNTNDLFIVYTTDIPEKPELKRFIKTKYLYIERTYPLNSPSHQKLKTEPDVVIRDVHMTYVPLTKNITLFDTEIGKCMIYPSHRVDVTSSAKSYNPNNDYYLVLEHLQPGRDQCICLKKLYDFHNSPYIVNLFTLKNYVILVLRHRPVEEKHKPSHLSAEKHKPSYLSVVVYKCSKTKDDRLKLKFYKKWELTIEKWSFDDTFSPVIIHNHYFYIFSVEGEDLELQRFNIAKKHIFWVYYDMRDPNTDVHIVYGTDFGEKLNIVVYSRTKRVFVPKKSLYDILYAKDTAFIYRNHTIYHKSGSDGFLPWYSE